MYGKMGKSNPGKKPGKMAAPKKGTAPAKGGSPMKTPNAGSKAAGKKMATPKC